MSDMMEEGSSFHEAPCQLYRLGDAVVCILYVNDVLYFGSGEDVVPALRDAFRTAFPDKDIADLGPNALMTLPGKDSLPIMGQ